MSLEDEATDIIHKAARGLGVPAPPHDTDDEIRAAAETLDLNADALLAVAHDTYRPGVSCPAQLLIVTTPYKDFTVNAYRVGSVCFDTGTDASQLTASGTPEALFITHQHPDHIADLKAFDGIPTHSPDETPLKGTYEIGGLTIKALPTPGHNYHDTTYLVSSPELPAMLAICGDLIFAGSIGGPNHSYEESLSSVREQLFTLPDDTILCPGHGPLTTVALEKANNPFVA